MMVLVKSRAYGKTIIRFSLGSLGIQQKYIFFSGIFVVYLATGPRGVSKSGGGDVPAPDSDPSVPRLRR